MGACADKLSADKPACAEPLGQPSLPVGATLPSSPPRFPPGRTSAPPVSKARRRQRREMIQAAYEMNLAEQPLGAGAFGQVLRATHKQTHLQRAVKKVPKEACNVGMLRQEMAIQEQLDHPNIAKLHEAYADAHSIYLVLELCNGGELYDAVAEAGKFSERKAVIVVQQMLLSVSYMHSKCIAHRDLKPENFLLLSEAPVDDNTLKLVDFGYAKEFVPGRPMRTKAGSAAYIAPQVLAGRYDELCDTWSLGVITYVTLCGSLPFVGQTELETMQKVRTGAYEMPQEEWQTISDPAKDLVKKLLRRNPKERLSALEALEHPWLKTVLKEEEDDDRLDARLCQKLRHFSNMSRLKRAAINVIASGVTDEQQQNQLRKKFAALDKDNSGTIKPQELREALGECCREMVDELFAGIDLDGSEYISYTEFLAALMPRDMYREKDNVRHAFMAMDTDKNGSISLAELAEALGVRKEDSMIRRLMDEADQDGDSKLDLQEFEAMMGMSPVRAADFEQEQDAAGPSGGAEAEPESARQETSQAA